MGKRRGRWIALGAVAVATIAAIGWMSWPRAPGRTDVPYAVRFGVPQVNRASGHVSASGTITNLRSSPARFEVHMECNPHTRHITGFGLHTPLLVVPPGSSSSWTARSAVLRTVARPGHPSMRVPISEMAHVDTWMSCSYWVATPGVRQ